MTPRSVAELTHLTPTSASRTTTPRPPTPMEPISAPVASEPVTPKLVARIMPCAGALPALLPSGPPVPEADAKLGAPCFRKTYL